MRPTVQCDLVNGPFGDPVIYADLMFERRAMLFDIGDITALPARKLLRLSDIFVSHAHMDHFAGFDHLLRLILGRDKTVSLYGPSGFIDQVEHKLHAYTWNVIRNYAGNLKFEVSEVYENGTLQRARFQTCDAFQREAMNEGRLNGDVLTSCDAFKVHCAVLDHDTPCLGFALEEAVHVNIWKARLDARNLVVGPWLRDLKHGILVGVATDTPVRALRQSGQGPAPITLPFGKLADLATVVPGQKVAYVVDVRNSAANADRIVHLVSHADMLFIECAFLDAEAEHAARKNHLTARQAGVLAGRAQVKRIVPCHFSARYANRGDALREEAQRAFQATGWRSENAPTIAGAGSPKSSAIT
jgi:ribonuclease Z